MAFSAKKIGVMEFPNERHLQNDRNWSNESYLLVRIVSSMHSPLCVHVLEFRYYCEAVSNLLCAARLLDGAYG